MSIITYTCRNGVQQLAADTQITDSFFGTKINVPRFKVVPWGRDSIIGVVGDAAMYGYLSLFHTQYDFPIIDPNDEYSLINHFHEYIIALRNFVKGKNYTEFDERDLNVIVVTPHGAVAADGHEILPIYDTYQMGTSLEVAAYILYNGGSALDAAQAVCETNITCSGPIELYTFSEDKPMYEYAIYDI